MELLFDVWYNRLVLWADVLLHDLRQSEDLVQELMLTLWERKESLEVVPEALPAFLFRSVRNNCLKRLTKHDVLRQPVSLDQVVLHFEEYQEKREELIRLVNREIEQLPPRSREVLLAVFADGLKYREVADKLGVSVSTVKTLLGLSVKKIRERFSEAQWGAILFFYTKNQDFIRPFG